MDKKKKRDGPRFVIRPSIVPIDRTTLFKGLFLEGIEKMREEQILF